MQSECNGRSYRIIISLQSPPKRYRKRGPALAQSLLSMQGYDPEIRFHSCMCDFQAFISYSVLACPPCWGCVSLRSYVYQVTGNLAVNADKNPPSMLFNVKK